MKQPWFKKGLRFKCTGCGKCCTGSPGYVYLSLQDLLNLATHCNLSEEEFKKRYTRMIEGQICLIDTPGTDACVFLKNNQCSAYDARPIQCRTFPWWAYHLESQRHWNEAGKHCEGINHPDAPVVDVLHIEVQCTTYLDNLIEQNFS